MDRLLQDTIPITIVYNRYVKKVEEIELFIKIAEEQKDFASSVEVEEKHQDYILGLRELANSVVLYNAAIISIYGSYELYIDEILRAYISYLKSRHTLYGEFPPKLTEKHINKAAEYLVNPNRFLKMGLSKEIIISALEATYIQGMSNELVDELLLSHGGNLSTKQLQELLQEYGFKEPISKIRKHDAFSKLCNHNGKGPSDNTFHILDRLVEERNKAGHGWIVENRLSFALLREEYLPFISGLCTAVKDLIISQVIQDHIDDNDLERFDPILHVWENGEVIGINSKQFRLKVGEYLYCTTSEKWNYMVEIKGLRNDDKERKEIRTTNKDITINTDKRLKENYIMWGYINDTK